MGLLPSLQPTGAGSALSRCTSSHSSAISRTRSTPCVTHATAATSRLPPLQAGAQGGPRGGLFSTFAAPSSGSAGRRHPLPHVNALDDDGCADTGAPGGGGDNDAATPSASALAKLALEEGAKIMATLSLGDGDKLLAWLPDSLLDSAISKQKRQAAAEGQQGQEGSLGSLTLRDCLKEATNDDESDFQWNSHAFRVLEYDPLLPSCENRSMMMLNVSDSNPSCLQRWAVQTMSGERMVLSMELRQTASLESSYKGIQVGKRWFLRSLRGEPDMDGEATPQSPSSHWGPEAVVQAQLEALREQDMERVWAFASPRNRAATGPLENFARMVRSNTYAMLLDTRAEVSILNAVQPSAGRFMSLISVKRSFKMLPGDQPSQHLFLWVVTRGVREDGPGVAWMTDAVQLITQQVENWDELQ